MTLEKLNRKIRECTKCRLWETAENAVPGEGSDDARVMLVGQNPGGAENETGKPFVGRAGKFLHKILSKNGINREDLFLTNVVKHKTPQNRKPRSDEIKACMPFLKEQIRDIKPEIIVLMGRVASQTPREEDIQYIETCHPAAAMRFPKMRKKFEKAVKTLSSHMTH